MDENENRRSEYTELCETIRHCDNLRFAILTVFVAFTGGLALFIFSEHHPESFFAQNTLKWSGIVVAVLFWIMEERTKTFLDYVRERAKYIEGSLKYSQYKRPKHKQKQLLIWPDKIIFWVFTHCFGKGISQWTRNRVADRVMERFFLTAQLAVRLVYFGVIIFWAITLCRPGAFLPSKKGTTVVKVVPTTQTLYMGP